ncbi:sodium-dependent transporter [Candidatus Aminicenantes bacterium AH-873-B07]|nr:sodium-dependent transporter [Candidatus Aminicenantes bacterium AH-873-B07]
MKPAKERGAWGSKIAFILAASGSAIGLGNIWRFPMITGKSGGAIFVFIYILAVIFIGFTVLLGEITIGRFSQKNPVGAFKFIKPGTKWSLVGYLGVLTGIFILSYYAVIAGWTLGYFVKFINGSFRGEITSEITTKIFSQFTSNPVTVLIYFFIIIGITTFIISQGVKGGIERWSKILMPILFILIIFLAVRAITLPGAEKGLLFYLKPDFSKLSGKIFLYAVGQAFFSLSLGMGTMITYGSYISKSDNLVTSAGWVAFSDTLIALLAGFIIFPTLFAIPGISPSAGAGLVFKVLPLVFSKLPGGIIFGSLFFLLLTIAALTSTISLLEVPVAYLVDEKNWSRHRAAFLTGLITFFLGIPSALSTGATSFLTKINFLSWIDLFFGNISLAVGALLICLFIGWIWGTKNASKEVRIGNPVFKIRNLWAFSVRFLSPLAIVIILIFIKTIVG